MFLIKKINAIGIIHLTEDNKELGCEAWNLSSSGIKKALELFLKTPHCLFVISSGWKDHLANRKVQEYRGVKNANKKSFSVGLCADFKKKNNK